MRILQVLRKKFAEANRPPAPWRIVSEVRADRTETHAVQMYSKRAIRNPLTSLPEPGYFVMETFGDHAAAVKYIEERTRLMGGRQVVSRTVQEYEETGNPRKDISEL